MQINLKFSLSTQKLQRLKHSQANRYISEITVVFIVSPLNNNKAMLGVQAHHTS